MKSGRIIHYVFTFLGRPNGPTKKDCLFVSLLLLLTVLARPWLDADRKTGPAGGRHLETTRLSGGRLSVKIRRSRTPLQTAGLLSVGVTCVAGNSSDTDSDSPSETDSAVGEEGENCESDPELPSEMSCLASKMRRGLRLDDEGDGDGGFAEPGLCPGQLGLLTLGGEYKPMAVAYAECSSGLSWCPEREQCLPMLRDSVILRRESWPFLPGAGADVLGTVRSPTQTWRSVKMRIPHSCYCGSRHHQPEDAELQAAVAQGV